MINFPSSIYSLAGSFGLSCIDIASTYISNMQQEPNESEPLLNAQHDSGERNDEQPQTIWCLVSRQPLNVLLPSTVLVSLTANPLMVATTRLYEDKICCLHDVQKCEDEKWCSESTVIASQLSRIINGQVTSLGVFGTAMQMPIPPWTSNRYLLC